MWRRSKAVRDLRSDKESGLSRSATWKLLTSRSDDGAVRCQPCNQNAASGGFCNVRSECHRGGRGREFRYVLSRTTRVLGRYRLVRDYCKELIDELLDNSSDY